MLTSAQKQLLHLLRQHPPKDEEEARHLKFALTYVELDPVCFDRRTVPAHVTGSAWVWDPAAGKLLLARQPEGWAWVPLGGHDTGEQDAAVTALHHARLQSHLPELALARPVQIMDVGMVDIQARGEEKAHRHIDIRFLAHGDATHRPDGVDGQVRWFALADAETLMEVEGMQRVVARLRHG